MYREVDLAPHHVDPLVDDLRPADRDEWVAASGLPVRETLLQIAQDESKVATVIIDEDERPLVVWGVIAPEGELWLAASIFAEKHVFSIHRHLKPTLSRLQTVFKTLSATCDARNEVHLKWLNWCGFKRTGTINVGPWDLPFHTHIRI